MSCPLCYDPVKLDERSGNHDCGERAELMGEDDKLRQDQRDRDAVESKPEPERCGICGFERVHVYPTEAGEETTAMCLHCGARYHASTGWIDPDEL